MGGKGSRQKPESTNRSVYATGHIASANSPTRTESTETYAGTGLETTYGDPEFLKQQKLLLEYYNKNVPQKQYPYKHMQELHQQKLIEEQRQQNLLAEHHRQRLLEEQRQQKLREELHQQKLREELHQQKLLEEQRQQKLLEEQRKQKFLEQQHQVKLAAEACKQKILQEQHQKKFLEEVLQQKNLEEQRLQTFLEQQHQIKLTAEAYKQRVLEEQHQKKLQEEQHQKKLLEEQHQQKLLEVHQHKKLKEHQQKSLEQKKQNHSKEYQEPCLEEQSQEDPSELPKTFCQKNCMKEIAKLYNLAETQIRCLAPVRDRHLFHAVLRDHLAANWNSMPLNKTFMRIAVQEDTDEFSAVKNCFNATSQKRFELVKIERVQNPFMLGCYILKKNEMISMYGARNVREKILFRGALASNIDKVCENNFDWRPCADSRGNKHGKGIYFSPISQFATHYSDKNASRKVMFLVRVLSSKITVGNETMEIPPLLGRQAGNKNSNVLRFDTTKRVDGKIIVKYSDSDFYPDYVIYYIVHPELGKEEMPN